MPTAESVLMLLHKAFPDLASPDPPEPVDPIEVRQNLIALRDHLFLAWLPRVLRDMIQEKEATGFCSETAFFIMNLNVFSGKDDESDTVPEWSSEDSIRMELKIADELCGRRLRLFWRLTSGQALAVSVWLDLVQNWDEFRACGEEIMEAQCYWRWRAGVVGTGHLIHDSESRLDSRWCHCRTYYLDEVGISDSQKQLGYAVRILEDRAQPLPQFTVQLLRWKKVQLTLPRHSGVTGRIAGVHEFLFFLDSTIKPGEIIEHSCSDAFERAVNVLEERHSRPEE